MAFPADFIENLKSANPIVDVIGSYVSLKKSSGRDYVCLCPFHNEKLHHVIFIQTRSISIVLDAVQAAT